VEIFPKISRASCKICDDEQYLLRQPTHDAGSPVEIPRHFTSFERRSEHLHVSPSDAATRGLIMVSAGKTWLCSWKSEFGGKLLGGLRRRQQRRAVVSSEQLEVRSVLSAVGGLTGALNVEVAGPQQIVNGTQTTAYPQVGICGDASGGFGSGTLIGSRFVLTAAHVTEGLGPTQGRFTVNGQTYSTVRIHNHPQYSSNVFGTDQAHDIAIMELDRDVVGVTPSQIFRATPTVGQVLTLVGFGGGGTGTTGHNGDFGIKRVGTTPVDQVTSTLIHWNFDNNTEANTAPGDSGGPAYVTINGQLYVAGVTSGGDQANAGIGDHSFDTRVDAYASWIDSIVGSNTGGGDGGGETDDHANSPNVTATPLALDTNGNGSATGTLEVAGDRDVFAITFEAGGSVTLKLDAIGDLDTYLRLYDANGQLVGENDDSNGTLNSELTTTVQAGLYYLAAGAYSDAGTGDYTASVTFTADEPAEAFQDYFFSIVDPATLINSDGSTLAVDDSDIIKLTVSSMGSYSYSIHFDGSDVGLTNASEDLDAFTVLADGRIVMSTSGTVSVPGLSGASNDLLAFTPSSLGDTTAGTWSVFLRGSSVRIPTTTAGNIDAVEVLPDGTLIVSTVGNITVGSRTFNREDLIKISGTTLSFYVDGSDIGLSTTGENIDAVDLQDDGTILVSTRGTFGVPGLSGGAADIAAFRPTQLGAATQGSFGSAAFLAAQQFGLQNVNLDGFEVGAAYSGNDDGGGDTAPPSTGGFQVTVRFTDNTLTAAQRAIFQEAANRWAQIIVGDIPDVVVDGLTVDDVVIDASAPTIDGSGGVLGQAGPTDFRSGTMLPSRGIMEFDQADLAELQASGDLLHVILHEMGHVLGIGTIWDSLGLVQDVGTEIHFTGARAVAEYNVLFGTSGNFVPVETDGGSGTAGGHWDEDTFDNELMTGYLNGGTQNPISRVTVGALADMGYQVNMAAADAFSAPRTARSKDTVYVWGGHDHDHGDGHAHGRDTHNSVSTSLPQARDLNTSPARHDQVETLSVPTRQCTEIVSDSTSTSNLPSTSNASTFARRSSTSSTTTTIDSVMSDLSSIWERI